MDPIRPETSIFDTGWDDGLQMMLLEFNVRSVHDLRGWHVDDLVRHLELGERETVADLLRPYCSPVATRRGLPADCV